MSVATMAYLEAHGVKVTPDELDAELAAAMERRAARLGGASDRELSADELEVLSSIGLQAMPSPAAERHYAQSLADYAALIKTSLSVDAMAERLGVNTSRIRQRLAERSLYGFRAGGRWRLPDFQLDGDASLPGLAAVLAVLDPELHPLEVETFFLTPAPELVATTTDGPLAPRDWLRLGLPTAAAVSLAAEYAAEC